MRSVSLALAALLLVGLALFSQAPIAGNVVGGSGGGSGGGCSPAGSANEILVDDGAGGCDSTPATVDSSGNMAAKSISTGTAPPTCTPGTGGAWCPKEGTAVAAEAGADNCYADSTAHNIQCSYNNGSFYPLVRVIASGAEALDTDEIASEDCDDQTFAASGAVSTDVVTFTPNADLTGVTGYAPLTDGGLYWLWWITSDTVHISVCNPTADPITPGAVTANWRITR